jgi:CheY-like chemotaxis protein
MDARVKARLFEPFFTTKGADRGTGLGLSIVHGAVMQADGEIRVDSQPGAGARFELLLPLAAAPTPTPYILPSVLPLDDHRTVCVLVVDDDVLVRRVAVRLLHKAGFQVVEAGDAEEALRVHASQATPVQLLLTDMMMPGDNGRTLARLLRARDPQLAVVYMSGYEADAFTDEPDAPEGPFVAKPFSEAQIIAAVRHALTPVRTAVPIV